MTDPVHVTDDSVEHVYRLLGDRSCSHFLLKVSKATRDRRLQEDHMRETRLHYSSFRRAGISIQDARFRTCFLRREWTSSAYRAVRAVRTIARCVSYEHFGVTGHSLGPA